MRAETFHSFKSIDISILRDYNTHARYNTDSISYSEVGIQAPNSGAAVVARNHSHFIIANHFHSHFIGCNAMYTCALLHLMQFL